MYLYHYTSKSGLYQILRDRIVNKSNEDTNHRYGPGVYLTSLSPKNNRDPADGQHSYLKFDFEDLKPYVEKVETKGDRDVWRYSKNIDLSKISYYYNENTSSGSQREIFKQPAESSLPHAEMYSKTNSSQLQQKQKESGSFVATTIITFASSVITVLVALGLYALLGKKNKKQNQE